MVQRVEKNPNAEITRRGISATNTGEHRIMPKKKKFRMRLPPLEPQRYSIHKSIPIHDGDSLHHLLDEVMDDINHGGFESSFETQKSIYEYAKVFLNYSRDMTDEEFQAGVEVYRKELEEYNKWCKDNEEEIKKYEAELQEARDRVMRRFRKRQEDKDRKLYEKLKKKYGEKE
jgi:predicted RNase H-like nuclease (RuvC/YqgF family)